MGTMLKWFIYPRWDPGLLCTPTTLNNGIIGCPCVTCSHASKSVASRPCVTCSHANKSPVVRASRARTPVIRALSPCRMFVYRSRSRVVTDVSHRCSCLALSLTCHVVVLVSRVTDVSRRCSCLALSLTCHAIVHVSRCH